MLFASDLIEHDGDLRDLPLIDRKRGLAKLIGKAKRRARHARQTNCIFPKTGVCAICLALSAWEGAQNSVIVECAPRC